MTDITTKFNDFKDRKNKNFEKDKEYQYLSDDIIAISKLDNGEYVKIKEPIEIVQITGMLTDEDEIKKLDEIAGGPVINTDLSLKQVKRGQEIWITCLLQKPTSAVYNSQSIGLLKVRIIDIFYGLSKLSTLK
ncbi:hypothetical protein M0Q97_12200 [Candidatus Dojkabacteria bacterium]|jgi:hypothetical protein|nr:hypothetical protein [Candidatus Dojkabacteria bacterium]